MNKYTLIAIFRGQDGSLGYKKGNQYILHVTKLSAWERFKYGAEIVIEKKGGGGRCPYKDMFSFLSNWEVTAGPKQQ